MDKPILIGNGQGFWGDSIDAPVNLVRGGPLDYLTLDYLAEVTMSILQRQKRRDSSRGYATDFVELIDRILPDILERDIKVIANAAGVNAEACLSKLNEIIKKQNLGKVSVGIVEGDDLLPRLKELASKGYKFEHLDTGEPLGERIQSITAANAYISSFPLAEALDRKAQIVLTGRATDPGLVLAPMIFEFGWTENDFDLLAAGTVAGHIVECGAQATGGNYSRWWEVPDYANIGYPIVEAYPNGSFVITKHKNTGGLINIQSVSEQILYELGDPKNYISPDVVVDFTSFRLEEDGDNRIKIDHVKGSLPTDYYKVSMAYHAGYKATGELTISGPRAVEKAKKVAEIIWDRLKNAGYEYDKIKTELLGTGASQGVKELVDLPEVVLRLSVRDENRDKITRFGKEIAPVITNGPPGITGFAGGRPKPQEIIAFWPTLIPKEEVSVTVRIETI